MPPRADGAWWFRHARRSGAQNRMIRTHPRNRIGTLLTANIRDQVARALEHLHHGVTIAGYGQHARSAVLVRLLISDVHWLARTERVSLRATPQLGYGLILVCAAAAKRSFEASFFDYVRVQDGLIIERVQQAGVLGQMCQLYGKALGLVGLDAMFLRL
jgi:hypothetical protein